MNAIEQRFYEAFYGYAKEKNREFSTDQYVCRVGTGYRPCGHVVGLIINWEGNDHPRKGRAILVPQIRVGPYCVDFLLSGMVDSEPCVLAIEVDGHDFHEKTKEQAAHDKKRDRYILIQGYRVMRFTASEVFNNSESCVLETLTAFVNIYMGIS